MTSKREKIKLLTLTPESWTQKKTANEFGISIHLVKQTTKLKKEKEILADPDQKNGQLLCETQLGDTSRMCPEKIDCCN